MARLRGPRPTRTRSDAAEEQAVADVVTIYSDGRRGNYWRQLQQLGPDYGGGDPDLSVLRKDRTLVCKALVVTHAMRQLRLMFDQESIPMPLFATISMWGGDDLLGEGDRQWAVGADDEAIRDRLTSGELSVPGNSVEAEEIHLCQREIGEAPSVPDLVFPPPALEEEIDLRQGHVDDSLEVVQSLADTTDAGRVPEQPAQRSDRNGNDHLLRRNRRLR